MNPDTGDSTCEIANYTGAQNEDGALVIDPTILPGPASQLDLKSPYNVAPFFHNYDYNFFYRNLEQNVVDRLSAYRSQ